MSARGRGRSISQDNDGVRDFGYDLGINTQYCNGDGDAGTPPLSSHLAEGEGRSTEGPRNSGHDFKDTKLGVGRGSGSWTASLCKGTSNFSWDGGSSSRGKDLSREYKFTCGKGTADFDWGGTNNTSFGSAYRAGNCDREQPLTCGDQSAFSELKKSKRTLEKLKIFLGNCKTVEMVVDFKEVSFILEVIDDPSSPINYTEDNFKSLLNKSAMITRNYAKEVNLDDVAEEEPDEDEVQELNYDMEWGAVQQKVENDVEYLPFPGPGSRTRPGFKAPAEHKQECTPTDLQNGSIDVKPEMIHYSSLPEHQERHQQYLPPNQHQQQHLPSDQHQQQHLAPNQHQLHPSDSDIDMTRTNFQSSSGSSTSRTNVRFAPYPKQPPCQQHPRSSHPNDFHQQQQRLPNSAQTASRPPGYPNLMEHHVQNQPRIVRLQSPPRFNTNSQEYFRNFQSPPPQPRIPSGFRPTSPQVQNFRHTTSQPTSPYGYRSEPRVSRNPPSPPMQQMQRIPSGYRPTSPQMQDFRHTTPPPHHHQHPPPPHHQPPPHHHQHPPPPNHHPPPPPLAQQIHRHEDPLKSFPPTNYQPAVSRNFDPSDACNTTIRVPTSSKVRAPIPSSTRRNPPLGIDPPNKRSSVVPVRNGFNAGQSNGTSSRPNHPDTGSPIPTPPSSSSSSPSSSVFNSPNKYSPLKTTQNTNSDDGRVRRKSSSSSGTSDHFSPLSKAMPSTSAKSFKLNKLPPRGK